MDISRPDPDTDPLVWYRETVIFGLDEWIVPGLRQQREALAQILLNPAQISRLQELDRYVVDAVTDPDNVTAPEELLTDDSAQPLSHWWWHLGQLHASVYPAELLPGQLREIYRQNSAYTRLKANTVST